jgi:hypothetical protein
MSAPPHVGLSTVQREKPGAKFGEMPFYGKARDCAWPCHFSSWDQGGQSKDRYDIQPSTSTYSQIGSFFPRPCRILSVIHQGFQQNRQALMQIVGKGDPVYI